MKKVTCVITTGDPSGIGPEITLKALKDPQVSKLANFIVLGDKFTSRKNFAFGKVQAEYGRASMEYLETALELIRARKADCLVTAPINKEAIGLAGYKTAGHTEYIANSFKIKNATMMLFNEKIRVSLVTQHIPLKDVAKSLKSDKILAVIRNTHAGLKSCFGIKNPRLGCCGLNPHASDNGTFGSEEKHIINPALNKARLQGINISPAMPADTIFVANSKNPYDAIVCMYHDQGLIPLKMSGFNTAVNITLGLPFIRTSPGHGTAFNIAGKNTANPASMILAIKSAIQCAKNLKKA